MPFSEARCGPCQTGLDRRFYWGQSDYYFTPALPLPLSDFNGEIETSRIGARCSRQTSRRSGRRGKSQSSAMQALEKAWLLAVYSHRSVSHRLCREISILPPRRRFFRRRGSPERKSRAPEKGVDPCFYESMYVTLRVVMAIASR
jgi:hypothetical protein